MVGPDPGTLSQDPICVGPGNHVVWSASNNVGALTIYFPVSGFPPAVPTHIAPFSDMKRVTTDGHDDWVFQHPGRMSTNSGPSNHALPGPPGTKLKFKYDQQIGNLRADGHMIIQK